MATETKTTAAAGSAQQPAATQNNTPDKTGKVAGRSCCSLQKGINIGGGLLVLTLLVVAIISVLASMGKLDNVLPILKKISADQQRIAALGAGAAAVATGAGVVAYNANEERKVSKESGKDFRWNPIAWGTEHKVEEKKDAEKKEEAKVEPKTGEQKEPEKKKEGTV